MRLTGKTRVLKIGVLFGLLLLIFFHVHSVSSDPVSYIYNNLGRLVATVSSNNSVILYQYDAAGKLISTTRTTLNKQLPVLTGINPNQVFIGNEVSISIAGNNLLQTQNVKSNNLGIHIKTFSSTNNSVNIVAEVSKTAVVGPSTFTVQTLSGSASIPFNLLDLVLKPTQVALLNGASADISARVEGLVSEYKLALINESPEIVQSPESLSIPVSGTASFVINAVSTGTGVIKTGNSGISVYVGSAYEGPVSPLSRPVSVKIKPSITSPVNAKPVSVKIPQSVQSQANSLPVSVRIPQEVQAPLVSGQISVNIETQ